MDWKPIGARTKGYPNNRWRDEIINGLEKLKLRNWSQVVKERKACNDVVLKTNNQCNIVLEEEEEEEEDEEEEKEKKEKEKKEKEKKKEKDKKREKKKY